MGVCKLSPELQRCPAHLEVSAHTHPPAPRFRRRQTLACQIFRLLCKQTLTGDHPDVQVVETVTNAGEFHLAMHRSGIDNLPQIRLPSHSRESMQASALECVCVQVTKITPTVRLGISTAPPLPQILTPLSVPTPFSSQKRALNPVKQIRYKPWCPSTSMRWQPLRNLSTSPKSRS